MLLAVVVGLVAVAALGTGVARAWHADGVTVQATCDSETGTYLVSATIQQSEQWPDAVVKSVTPSSFPGSTSGQQSVTVVIGWDGSQETQTFHETVDLGGDCGGHPVHHGTLTVIKHVVNDDGGTASAGDFTMHVSGPTTLSFPGAGSPGTTSNVLPGGYTVTESGPSGYALSYSGDCDSGGHVTVSALHPATCTLTNNDIPHEAEHGTLTVVKHVVNDDGGTASAGDFTMHVSGPTTLSFPGAGSPGTTSNVLPGGYTVTESGPSGYALSYSGDCDASGHVTVPPLHSATCVLTNDDVRRHSQEHGSISVSKSADPTAVKEPGGLVTYSVRITNTSAEVDVTIQNVVDDKFGDLDDEGGNGCFDVPFKLKPGESKSCQFQKQITGVGGTRHVNTVTASGVDENGNPVSASDSATVDITPLLIDLVIDKQATSPTPLNGIVHYTMTVTNKGPETATNVQLADPAPAGITYLTANPSQGTCSVDPALVTCSLGSIAPGQTVTIDVTARATTVGSHTNTATVTGSGGSETNPADNFDSAVTIVFTPPTPKPKPKPHPKPCIAVTVTPKMIKADGKTDRVVVKVTAGGKAVKGAKVLVQGAGIRKSGRSDANGTVVIIVNPTKAGLITITTPETRRSCGAAHRIGVLGIFLPPLTG